MTPSDLARALHGDHDPEDATRGAKGRSRVSEYLLGKRVPRRDTISRIAAVLKCRESELAPEQGALRAKKEWPSAPRGQTDLRPRESSLGGGEREATSYGWREQGHGFLIQGFDGEDRGVMLEVARVAVSPETARRILRLLAKERLPEQVEQEVRGRWRAVFAANARAVGRASP